MVGSLKQFLSKSLSVAGKWPLLFCRLNIQGTELMSKYGVNVPESSVDEVQKAIKESFAEVVVKSQILAGGRGLGTFKNGLKGGVHIVKKDQAADLAGKMLGQILVTKQSGPQGKPVNREEAGEQNEKNMNTENLPAVEDTAEGNKESQPEETEEKEPEEKEPWERPSEFHQNLRRRNSVATGILPSGVQYHIDIYPCHSYNPMSPWERPPEDEYALHFDASGAGQVGGAIAWVLRDNAGNVIAKRSSWVDDVGGNTYKLEFRAILDFLKDPPAQCFEGGQTKKLTICSDDDTVVQQVLWASEGKTDMVHSEFALEVWNLIIEKFPNSNLKHVLRSRNRLANSMANTCRFEHLEKDAKTN